MHGYGSKETFERELERTSAYLHGRFETELEFYAHSRAIPPVELITRVGKLLLGLGERSIGDMPKVRVAAGKRSARAQKVEGARKSHGNVRKVKARARSTSKIGRPKKKIGYWARMTPKQRSEEMNRRMAKRNDPMAKKMIHAA